jgi:hypothetical protein
MRQRIDKHVLPTRGAREFASIRRGDVTQLLDAIAEDAGPVAADKMLAITSKIFNWYATRHDDYTSPIVRGMRRSNPKDRARTRILNDDEIRGCGVRRLANAVILRSPFARDRSAVG